MSISQSINNILGGVESGINQGRSWAYNMLDDVGQGVRRLGSFTNSTGARIQNSRFVVSDPVYNGAGITLDNFPSIIPVNPASSPSQQRMDTLIGWGFVGVVGFVAWTALSKGGK